MGRKKDFAEDIKLKCLLWSDRHCCICEKACGLDIQVAHIDANGGSIQDNAIPLCYKCHADVGRYVDKHPLGTKYRIAELKKRRDQIYERYTSHLVPGILAVFHPVSGEKSYKLPQVGFSITPVGRFIPVKARITVRAFLCGNDLGVINDAEKPYYSGKIIWNLNPGLTFGGNFSLPKECAEKNENLQLELSVTVIDPYEREHELLPVCFTYVRTGEYWFLEPTSFNELKRHRTTELIQIESPGLSESRDTAP
jgi:hypothetical protein